MYVLSSCNRYLYFSGATVHIRPGPLHCWGILITHTHTNPEGLLWTGDQPVAKTSTYTIHNKQERDILFPQWGSNPWSSNRGTADLCLWQHGHHGQHNKVTGLKNIVSNHSLYSKCNFGKPSSITIMKTTTLQIQITLTEMFTLITCRWYCLIIILTKMSTAGCKFVLHIQSP
jgi:hypothetical protein